MLDQLRRELQWIPCQALTKGGGCADPHCVYRHANAGIPSSGSGTGGSPSVTSNVPNTSTRVQTDVPPVITSTAKPSPMKTHSPPTVAAGPESPSTKRVELLESLHSTGTPGVDNLHGAKSPGIAKSSSELAGASGNKTMVPPPNSAFTPSAFHPLIQVLQELLPLGITKPLRSAVGEKLKANNPKIYQKAGVTSFKAYAELAARAGLVRLNPGKPGSETISLVVH